MSSVISNLRIADALKMKNSKHDYMRIRKQPKGTKYQILFCFYQVFYVPSCS